MGEDDITKSRVGQYPRTVDEPMKRRGLQAQGAYPFVCFLRPGVLGSPFVLVLGAAIA